MSSQACAETLASTRVPLGVDQKGQQARKARFYPVGRGSSEGWRLLEPSSARPRHLAWSLAEPVRRLAVPGEGLTASLTV